MDYVYSGNLINYRLRFLIYLMKKDSHLHVELVFSFFEKKKRLLPTTSHQHHQKLS